MMKYVCFINTETGIEEVILFPKNIHHDCFVEGIEGLRNQSYGMWERQYRKPVSAGFVGLVKGKLVCEGRSETLSLQSRPKDTELLQQQMGLI